MLNGQKKYLRTVLLAKWCPIPPAVEANGTVYVRNAGNRYGAVCLGSDAAAGPAEVSSCPLVSVVHEKVRNGTTKYTFIVTSDTTRTDKIYFKIRFDAPITEANVSKDSTHSRSPVSYLSSIRVRSASCSSSNERTGLAQFNDPLRVQPFFGGQNAGTGLFELILPLQ